MTSSRKLRQVQHNRVYRARHKDKLKVTEAVRRVKRAPDRRAWNLKRKFGMTVGEWQELFEYQDSKCAVCKTGTPDGWNGWATDHCHRTGEIRGILCSGCNLLLGKLGDNYEEVLALSKVFLSYLYQYRRRAP